MLARKSDLVRLALSAAAFACCNSASPLALRDVPRRGEDTLQRTVPVIKGGRVVGHYGLLAVAGARCQFVVVTDSRSARA